MANQQAVPAVERRSVRGEARFWVPFAAIVLVFSGLGLAYSSSERARDAAPGAVRRGPASEEEPRHGLEPEPEAAPAR